MSSLERRQVRRRLRKRAHPGVVIVLGFALFAALGATILWLPISQQEGASVSPLEAFFTSVSAVTVTGLAVADTASTWNTFGLCVLLVLIQVGGLGIMTIAGFFGLIVSQRLSVRAGMLASTEIGVTQLGPLGDLVKGLIKFVFASEFILAIALSTRFVLGADDGAIAKPIFDGVFHAVSAFNNAGFSTFSNGLADYVSDWFVSISVALGFIVGGMGFPVIFELWRRWRDPTSWSLHTKVSLSSTVFLLVGGTLLIALLEWTNPETLGTLPDADRVLAAFFQSASTRTAGFNTVAIESLRPSTLLLFVPLMVVGANSASTGGGIKTTTVAVAIQATVGQLRGDRDVTMFEKRIPRQILQQSLALVIAALAIVGTAGFMLAVVEPNIDGFKLLFEAASAFGTAGLSAGVTPHLGTLGRILIIVLMFIGRVGPITFGTAFLFRAETHRYRFPQDDLLVG